MSSYVSTHIVAGLGDRAAYLMIIGACAYFAHWLWLKDKRTAATVVVLLLPFIPWH